MYSLDLIPFFLHPLEVVRYLPGEQFGLHHDASAAFQRRVATLLIYLNGDGDDGSSSISESSSSKSNRDSDSSSLGGISGGETYFPFAVGDTRRNKVKQQLGATSSLSSSSASGPQSSSSPPWRMNEEEDSATTISPRAELERALRHAATTAGASFPRGGRDRERDEDSSRDEREGGSESRRGVKVAPMRGKAMLFYNLDWGSGQPDPAVLERAKSII